VNDDAAAELRHLRAEIAALRADHARAREEHLMLRARHAPLARALGKVFTSLEQNPRTQYTVHVWAMRTWMMLTAVTLVVFFTASRFWAAIAVLWLTMISYYANWATDFDGASSSLAALNAREARREAEAAAAAAGGGHGMPRP
jgi:hypothetical protein